MILIPRRKVNSSLLLPKPPVTPPTVYKILWIKEMPLKGQEGLTVAGLVESGLDNETLRLVLDWILFTVLEDYHKVRKRAIKAVWTYLYEDTNASLANWRAMAVWVDPKLPRKSLPSAARIGGDAIQKGAVEYDFTNPVNKEGPIKGG